MFQIYRRDVTLDKLLLTDSNRCKHRGNLSDYLDNLDLLVHECTYTQGVYNHLPEKVLHTTAKDLGEAAEEKGVKNLIATHINPRYSKNSKLGIEMIYNEIREGYSGRLFIANDFDVYMVGKDRVVRKV